MAALPEGQRTRDVSSESSAVVWQSAMSAVEEVEASRMAMPPTYLTCLDVGQPATVAEVLAFGDREVAMFMPEVEPLDDGYTLSMPDDLRPLIAARRS